MGVFDILCGTYYNSRAGALNPGMCGNSKMNRVMFPLMLSLSTFGLAVSLGGCGADEPPAREDFFTRERRLMVERQIKARGIKDERVLAAMLKVPRHEFVPEDQRPYAYEDRPLPIGEGQTISQPYIVAYMTEALALKPTDKVLEIGTGSGYQAAILCELAKEVCTIEIVPSLAKRSEETLRRLEYKNVQVKCGDGYQGWKEHAPFDCIIVTCAPNRIPQPLIEQLREGGLMIIPVGESYHQNLVLVTKKNGKAVEKAMLPVLFVPMTGEAQKR